jgi:hypothetical protein
MKQYCRNGGALSSTELALEQLLLPLETGRISEKNLVAENPRAGQPALCKISSHNVYLPCSKEAGEDDDDAGATWGGGC